MKEDIVTILYNRITGSKLTYEDELLLERWIAESPRNRELYNEVMNPSKLRSEIQVMLGYDSKDLWEKISQELSSKESRAGRLYKKLLGFVSATAQRASIPKHRQMNDKNLPAGPASPKLREGAAGRLINKSGLH